MRRYVLMLIAVALVGLAGCSAPSQPTPTADLQTDQVQVRHCLSSIGSDASVDLMRQDLLTEAKRQAVGSLYGEELKSLTLTENLSLSLDQIQIYTAGKVRILGEPQYASGSNLGDVCVSAKFYVTPEDRADFQPKTIEGRICRSTDQIDRNNIRNVTARAAELDTLHRYDTRLRNMSEDDLLQLFRNVIYTEDGFVQDTPTYCVSLQGEIVPVEIKTAVDDMKIGQPSISEALLVIPKSPENALKFRQDGKAVEIVFEQFSVRFVYVPVGRFLVGSTDTDIEAAYASCVYYGSLCQRQFFINTEMPQHEVSLNAFWIMETKVTNSLFRQFVIDSGYTRERYWTRSGLGILQSEKWIQPGCWGESVLNADLQPVVCISWFEASAFAKWLSEKSGMQFRLPTEVEWEKAARGTESFVYPWGNEWKVNTANTAGGEDGYSFSAPVQSFTRGVSPYGAYDLAGNAAEWTSTIESSYPYDAQDGRESVASPAPRVTRGGSYNNLNVFARSAARSFEWPVTRESHVGFRLVWDEDE